MHWPVTFRAASESRNSTLPINSLAERLRQLLEAKQQLLRDVSHELRSPLTRLQLALSLARREHSSADRYLARIASEADRLEQLIARTLKLVRLERPASAPIEQRSLAAVAHRSSLRT